MPIIFVGVPRENGVFNYQYKVRCIVLGIELWFAFG